MYQNKLIKAGKPGRKPTNLKLRLIEDPEEYKRALSRERQQRKTKRDENNEDAYISVQFILPIALIQRIQEAKQAFGYYITEDGKKTKLTNFQFAAPYFLNEQGNVRPRPRLNSQQLEYYRVLQTEFPPLPPMKGDQQPQPSEKGGRSIKWKDKKKMAYQKEKRHTLRHRFGMYADAIPRKRWKMRMPKHILAKIDRTKSKKIQRGEFLFPFFLNPDGSLQERPTHNVPKLQPIV